MGPLKNTTHPARNKPIQLCQQKNVKVLTFKTLKKTKSHCCVLINVYDGNNPLRY